MSSIAIDTSVLIAILQAEPEAPAFAQACLSAGRVVVSAATMHEAFSVVVRRRLTDGIHRLEKLTIALDLIVVDFTAQQLTEARKAYQRYGRGTNHRADLNMGDCFSYALAKVQNLPLLFKGNDFTHTDIEPVWRSA